MLHSESSDLPRAISGVWGCWGSVQSSWGAASALWWLETVQLARSARATSTQTLTQTLILGESVHTADESTSEQGPFVREH